MCFFQDKQATIFKLISYLVHTVSLPEMQSGASKCTDKLNKRLLGTHTNTFTHTELAEFWIEQAGAHLVLQPDRRKASLPALSPSMMFSKLLAFKWEKTTVQSRLQRKTLYKCKTASILLICLEQTLFFSIS